MIYIAANDKEQKRTGLKDVTDAIGSPEAFTAKILQQLVKGRLLESFRGPTGGFVLPSKKKILLYDIVATIDGEHLMNDCILGLSACSSTSPCPVHDKFQPIRRQLKETLLATEIREVDLLQGGKALKI